MGGLARSAGLALVGVGLIATGLSGCSGSAGRGASSPSQAVESFMHAIGDKSPDAACAVVATGGKPLEGDAMEQCKVGIQKVLAEVQSEEFARLRAAKVTGANVSGDHATVKPEQITNVPAGYQNSIDLVRIGGAWYIDSKG